MTGLTIAGYIYMCALFIVLHDPYCAAVPKGAPHMAGKDPEAVTWGSLRIPTVSCLAFTRLQHFLDFLGSVSLRLATPTLHGLRRQTNTTSDHTTPPPPPPPPVFLSRHRSENARSIYLNGSERIALISWTYDRLVVLPGHGVGIFDSRMPGQRVLASASSGLEAQLYRLFIMDRSSEGKQQKSIEP